MPTNFIGLHHSYFERDSAREDSLKRRTLGLHYLPESYQLKYQGVIDESLKIDLNP